jgi:hypothetical protein
MIKEVLYFLRPVQCQRRNHSYYLEVISKYPDKNRGVLLPAWCSYDQVGHEEHIEQDEYYDAQKLEILYNL